MKTLLTAFDTNVKVVYNGSLTHLRGEVGEVFGPCPCRVCPRNTKLLLVVLDGTRRQILEHVRATSLTRSPL